MKREQIQIDAYTQDGKLKSKEMFLEQFSEIWEQLREKEEETQKEEKKEQEDEFSYLSVLVDPNFQIDIPKMLETNNFYQRHIFLNTEITVNLARQVFECIKLWNEIDDDEVESGKISEEQRLPIVLFIDSVGGDLGATLSIIDAIKLSRTPVYTCVNGLGASGGFFIAINGHKRFCTENCVYLFHEGFNSYAGDAHKFIQQTDYYKKQLNKLKEITLKNTKISKSDYQEHQKDDWWFTSEEALKYGIVDEILTLQNNELF